MPTAVTLRTDIEATLVRFRVLCAGEKRGRVGYYR